MAKSVFYETVMDELIERISKLSPTSERQWGMMTVEEMMHHCRLIIERVLMSRPTDKKSTLKQRLLKFYFMNIAASFPKNVATPKLVDMKLKKNEVEDFAIERSKLLEALKKFSRSKGLMAVHPYFGKLDTKEWGIFT